MRMMRCISPLALLLVGTSLGAQETTGVVTGTVRTKAGKAIGGITVRFTSPALLKERITVTDDKGAFRVPLLPVGTYTLVFAGTQHVTNKATLTLLAGQVVRQDAILITRAEADAVVGATVTVETVAPQLSKTETITQTVFSQEKLSRIMGTGNYAAINLAPGIAGGSMGSIGDGYQVRGGTNNGFKVMQDGVVTGWGGYNVNGTIPDMIESAGLVVSPLNAKYGNTDGGVFNIVTTRGSNEFEGTLRRTFRRSMWSANSPLRPGRNGELLGVHAAVADDPVNGEWQITLKGPIWKDHLTFAYGGRLMGTTRAQQTLYNTTNLVSGADTRTQSVYFSDPGNLAGTGLMAADTGDLDNKLVSTWNKMAWNQYKLFWQISQDHSLEGGYTKQDQSGSTWQNGGRYTPLDPGSLADSSTYGAWHRIQSTYSVSYKALLGGSSLLNLSIGRSTFRWQWFTNGPSAQYWLFQNQVPDGEGGFRKANNILDAWYNNTPRVYAGGADSDIGDKENMQHWSANYQTVLEWHGTHNFEAGLEMQNFWYDAQAPGGNPMVVYPVGRIARTGVASQYAGKYVVFPYTATVGDLTGGGPWTYMDYNVPAGTSVISQDLGTGGADDLIRSLVPYVKVQTGAPSGRTTTGTVSLYANDLWTLSPEHSLMMGIRVDRFSAKDLAHSILSYTSVLPRFEYKWDIGGREKHILSASYAWFQEDMPNSTMASFSQGRLSFERRAYWSGAVDRSPYGNPNAPYLVSQDQLMNLANYDLAHPFAASRSGGPSSILDSSVRAPRATQYEIAYRHALPEGGFLRAATVLKTWTNLMGWFPTNQGLTVPNDPEHPELGSSNYLPAVFRNDSDCERTYKSFELEWNFVLSDRLSVGGRYSHIRFTGNDSGYNDRPDGAGRGAVPIASYQWRNYYAQYIPRDVWNPVALKSGNNGNSLETHAVRDFSSGKVRQYLSVRAYYTPAQPYSITNSYNVPGFTAPGYSGPAPTSSIAVPIEGAAAWKGTDTWSTALHYSLELPIYKRLRWFFDADISNWLGIQNRSGYFASGMGAGNLPLSSYANGDPLFLHGQRPRGSQDTRGAEGAFNNLRSVSIETGFRF